MAQAPLTIPNVHVARKLNMSALFQNIYKCILEQTIQVMFGLEIMETQSKKPDFHLWGQTSINKNIVMTKLQNEASFTRCIENL